MALKQVKFLPGVDKQNTTIGAVGRWIDSNNVRWRYGLPEKVGGWSSLLASTLVGVARKQHAYTDLEGNRYVIIGTDKFLIAYFEGEVYDITPLRTTLTSATIATTNGSATCTVTKATHGLSIGDIVQLDSVTLPGGTGYNDSDFEDKYFQVITVPTTGTFTITQTSNAGATVSTGGSLSIKCLQPVGPAEQSYGYGWGLESWNTGGFGSAASASNVTLEPGLWSLDNFGEVLVATILNGKTFTWNAGDAARFTTRASTTTSNFSTTNNPTATRLTLISPTTRHLIHCGTETTIGTDSTQDDMFIRFSNAEDINTYGTSAINTAGSQRLQDGTKIMGALKAKETILIWTDNALYTMKTVGAPFTFGFEQVGTNCGLIGQNAAVEIDGIAYWMSPNGFFLFDGTVKSLDCSVEDYVYDDIESTKGQQINCGLNNLYTEVVWYYPASGQNFNNRYVVYNYGETASSKATIWYTGNEARTTWLDASVYPKPYATKYDSSTNGSFPAVRGITGLGSTTIFEHETGTDQVNADGSKTTITSFAKSFDFDIKTEETDGEFFLSLKRFIPDFKNLQGNAKLTLAVKRFPSQSSTNTALSPFTITSSSLKFDTRARGRYANIKIENDAVSETWRFGTINLDLRPDGRR
mgnify:FL=1